MRATYYRVLGGEPRSMVELSLEPGRRYQSGSVCECRLPDHRRWRIRCQVEPRKRLGLHATFLVFASKPAKTCASIGRSKALMVQPRDE